MTESKNCTLWFDKKKIIISSCFVDGDTLNKIAAMHDTTPTKLAQINKMSGSRFVFPGMNLKLPPPEPVKVKTK